MEESQLWGNPIHQGGPLPSSMSSITGERRLLGSPLTALASDNFRDPTILPYSYSFPCQKPTEGFANINASNLTHAGFYRSLARPQIRHDHPSQTAHLLVFPPFSVPQAVPTAFRPRTTLPVAAEASVVIVAAYSIVVPADICGGAGFSASMRYASRNAKRRYCRTNGSGSNFHSSWAS